jgi:helix-turn-helix protein
MAEHSMADQRQFSIVPIRALLDERVGMADKAVLLALGAHTDRLGLCFPLLPTLSRYAGLEERATRNALRRLEEHGYLRTWKDRGRNQYQVLYDAPAPEITMALALGEDRHGDAGVASDKQHRHGGAGSAEVPEDRHWGAGAAPGCRSDRHDGADETGTVVPPEREQERDLQRLPKAAAAAREGALPLILNNPETSATTRDTNVTPLDQLAIDLAIAANRALQENPHASAQAMEHSLSAALALTPLQGWLAEGIPFAVIREAVAQRCRRFKPVQPGQSISRFTYFDRAIHEAWERSRMNVLVDAATPARTPPSTVPRKIRRLV